MVTLCSTNLVILLSIVFLETLLCQPIPDNDHKQHYSDINEPDLRIMIAKSLSRHPLGILGHLIVEAVDMADNEGLFVTQSFA